MNYIFSPSTDLSLNVDYFFGDAQDAFSLGLYAQTRF